MSTITCEHLWPVLSFLLVAYEYTVLKTVDVRYRHQTFDFTSLLLLFRAAAIFVISLPDLFRTNLQWIDFWTYPSLRLWFEKVTGLSGAELAAFFR